MAITYKSVLGSSSSVLSGDAEPSEVLSGKTFYSDSDVIKTGTMTDNGGVTPSGLNCGGSYTIPEGYHDGTGVVTANSLASQTGVERDPITPSVVLKNYQGWVNGEKITGELAARRITPSNVSPVSVTEGEVDVPTANGYLISSYSSLSPQNGTPPSITSGNIYKASANGYAISSYSSISPSNSSPVSLSSGSFYKPSSSGYAISSYTSKTPSSSPSSVSSGSIYKMGGSGYVINTYSSSSKTPSSSGTSFSSGWNYMTSSGYAYSSQPSTAPNFSETTLWTNSSPTSSFANQTIYVPEWQYYKYLKVYVRYATNDSESSYGLVDCYALYNEGGDHSVAYISAKYSTNTNEAPYIRGIRDNSSNYLYITRARQLTSAAQSFSNTYCIPTKIVGIFYNYGPGDELLEEDILLEP